MATVSTFLTGPAIAANYNIGGRVAVAENILDFSETNVSNGDVVQAIQLPANAFVKDVWIECMTAEGATATANVGDGTDADGWDATVNLNSAAGMVIGDGAYAGGKLYSSSDTIDLTVTADLDAAKVRVVAEYVILELS